ncbi:MAG: RsmB/NOP family class I SAM-dependent RNA methyltransferase [Candidatus Ranarchaeia archaeon]
MNSVDNSPLELKLNSFLDSVEVKELLDSLSEELPQYIRINTLKVSNEEVIQRLSLNEISLEEIKDVPYGFKVSGEKSAGSLHEYLYGYYYVQSKASMLPPIALDPQQNEIILDMAAAPGGKTTHISQLMENSGILVATDIISNKLEIIQNHLWRMGISNTVLVKGDSRDFLRSKPQFDRVLLDAPCTGSGIPNPIKNQKRNSTINISYSSQLQSQLMDAAVAVLKPEGVLVYSTCSLFPEENELIVDTTLRRYPNLELVDLPFKSGDPGFTNIYGRDLIETLKKTRRFYSHKHDTIGFFISKFKKKFS